MSTFEPAVPTNGPNEVARRLADHSELLIAVLDSAGTVLDVNDSGCRLSGYAAAQLIGRDIWQTLFCDADTDHVAKLIKHLSEHNEVTDSLLHLKTHDGSLRAVALSVFNECASDDAGTVVLVCRPVDDGESKGPALTKSLPDIQGAHRAARMGLWRVDLATDLVWLSPDVRELFGDIGGRDTATAAGAIWRYIHPDDRERTLSEYQAGASVAGRFELNYRLRGDSSQVKHVRCFCETFCSTCGDPERIVAIAQDVSQQVADNKRFQQRLEESRWGAEYYDHIVEHSPSFIIGQKPDGTAVSINAAGLRITGYSREEIIGVKVWDLFFPDDVQSELQGVMSENDLDEFETALRTKSGEIRAITWTTVNRYDENNVLQEIIGIGTDVTERNRAQFKLREREATLHAAQRIARLGSWEQDLINDRLEWSGEGLRVLEAGPERRAQNFEEFLQLIYPADQSRVRRTFQIEAPNANVTEVDFRLVFAGGRSKHVRAHIESKRDSTGTCIGFRGALQDVSEQVAQEIKLKETLAETKDLQQYTDYIVEHSPAFIIGLKPDGTVISINRAGCEISGYTREEIVGRDWNAVTRVQNSPRESESLFQALERGPFLGYELPLITKHGEERVLSWTRVHHTDEIGELSHIIAIGNDITELKRSQKELRDMAHHDALTGLPNRVYMTVRLDLALQHANATNQVGALFFLDLDRFKDINDGLGHSAGDALLIQVARRLTASLRDDDTVARIGGDEFTILVENVHGPQAATAIGNKLLRAFEAPFEIEGRNLHVTPSIGISLFPQDGPTIEDLLRNADTAMYKAKSGGRNALTIYSKDMTTEANQRIDLANELRAALEEEQLFICYQPQLCLESGRVIGAECLIRWRHPVEGLMSPARFIPFAEETGLIVPIGAWVLNTACTRAKRWLDEGLDIGRIAVNVAGPQLSRGNLVEDCKRALLASGLPAEKLELEVTEGFIMDEADQAVEKLEALRDLGLRLSIDDFGTGYSSLAYLKRLPLDKLKIDQSFVRGLPDDVEDAGIVKAIIALSEALSLGVIAEGVETAEQRSFLLDAGCTRAQGYYYSKPLEADEFKAWVEQQRTVSS